VAVAGGWGAVRTCDHCGQELTGRPAVSRRGKYGLDLCFNCWRRLRSQRPGGTRQAKSCEQCGAVFYVTPYEAERRRFCSRSCRGRWQRDRVTRTCAHCGRRFEVRRSKSGALYCSRQCWAVGRKRKPNDALRAARQRAGLSQTELARWVEVDTKTANRWERLGFVPRSAEVRAAVADLLGCWPWPGDPEEGSHA
jgi:DNA-binding XRE family transcriptional regulator/transcription elongation factor Elf1